MGFDIAAARAAGYSDEEIKAHLATMQQQAPSTDISKAGQAGITALQGGTFGFGDEIAGVGGAVIGSLANLAGVGDGKSFAQSYRETRDKVRGAEDSFKNTNPMAHTSLKIAGGLPLIVGAPATLGASGQAVMGVGSRAAQAAKVGAGYGGVSGVGESNGENAGEIIGDGLKGAAISGVLGAAGEAVIPAVGAVASNIAQRVAPSGKSAADYAKLKVAQAFARDNIVPDAASFARMGKEARVADAGDESVKGLLDLMATLPGDTKAKVEAMIRNRQAGRGGRIIDAADESLGTRGADYVQAVNDLVSSRSKAATPYYDQLKGLSVNIDPELSLLLQKASPYLGDAERKAILETGSKLNIKQMVDGDAIPFEALDRLKRTLYGAAQKEKVSGDKDMGLSIDGVRTSLIDKLDRVSPIDKATGQSVYKLGRDAFAGHSELIDAAKLGSQSMGMSTAELKQSIAGMTKSELEAFRIGAWQSLKDKAGTEGGQTSMLKYWKEPATQERFKLLFGGKYDDFASSLANEGKLKRLESVGRGSQTEQRRNAADDLDISPLMDAAQAAGGVASMDLKAAGGPLARLWGRVKTPESVRNNIGDILLQGGNTGSMTLQELVDVISKVNSARSKEASRVGAFMGIVP